MMRAYVQLVSSHWSPHWRMFRRWVIFKFYAEYLVKTCQNDSFVASENNRYGIYVVYMKKVSAFIHACVCVFIVYLMMQPHLTSWQL